MKKAQARTKRPSASPIVVENGIVINTEHPETITVRKARILDGYRVRMTFSNNEIRELDLKPYLRGPVFKPLRDDYELFRRLYIDPETETVTWQNGADMDPQTLYEDSIAMSKSSARSPASSGTKGKKTERTPAKGLVNRRSRRQPARQPLRAKHK
jgi:hypothetical protein